MKAALYRLPLLGLLCLLLFSATPGEAQSTNKDYFYTIHIGAFVKAKLSDFNTIRPLGFVYADVFDNSLLRVYLGDYQDETSANAILTKVKSNGYPDAYVTRKGLNKDAQLSMIQLGTASLSDKIDWERYAVAGSLFVTQDGRRLKIMAGPYDNLDQAQARLKTIRSGGFKDAFVKNVNHALTHEITAFEAGRQLNPANIGVLPEQEELAVKGKEEPIFEEPVALVETGDLPDTAPAATPQKAEPVPPPAEPIPDSYDEVITVKGPTAVPMPTIRTKVKRNSAIELQKILKASKVYSGPLDGYYGKGTTAGYNEILQTNKQLRKYVLLDKYTRDIESPAAPNSLQYLINTLATDYPNAVRGLEASSDPVAKAYLAYWLFTTRGQQLEVDDLMNKAIKGAFRNKKLKNKPPFDYQSDYSYRSLEQLMMHLAYIQAVSTKANAVPCWMFRQHPEAAAKAFDDKVKLDIQACDEFVNWPELSLVRTIAADLNPQGMVDAGQLADYTSERARLLLTPQDMSAQNGKAMIDWHNSLIEGLDAWAAKEGLHQKLVTPLKVAYFQSMVRLEDYFMDKGLKPRSARHLAIGVLKTMVDQHLKSYAG